MVHGKNDDFQVRHLFFLGPPFSGEPYFPPRNYHIPPWEKEIIFKNALKMLCYCWWTKSCSPVEVGSLSHYSQDFKNTFHTVVGCEWDFWTINSSSQFSASFRGQKKPFRFLKHRGTPVLERVGRFRSILQGGGILWSSPWRPRGVAGGHLALCEKKTWKKIRDLTGSSKNMFAPARKPSKLAIQWPKTTSSLYDPWD